MENNTTTFTSGEAIRFGWEKMKKHFWFFVVLLILIWAVQIVPTSIAEYFKKEAVLAYVFFSLAAWIIQIIVNMGTLKITLDVIDKEKGDYGTLLSNSHLWIKFILGSLLYMLIVLGGFILLVVPGIIWAIKYQFFGYLIVEKNMSPVEAIKKSGEITQGNKGKLFGLGLLFLLMNIAGAICFLIGLFATIPTTMMATAYVYRKLMGEMAPKSEPIEAPAN